MASRTVKVVFKAEGIKAITRQVENLNSALKGNSVSSRKAAKSTDNLDRVQRKAAKSAQELSFITKRLTASYLAGNIGARAISAGVSRLTQTFSYGIGSAISYGFSIQKISSISGVAGKELSSLNNTIKNIASQSPKTSTEVANAALEMSKMGLAGKDLENSLAGVVGLSVALDESVERVGTTVVNIKNVFQKDASEITNIADKMFTALGNSALNLSKFSTAFSFAGASARLAGVSFEELTGLMGVLADNGVKASTIGTQLRQVFTRLDDPTSKVSALLGENSIKARGLSQTLLILNKVIKDSGQAKELFGQRAIGVIDILTKNIDKIEELTGKTREMEKSTLDASDALGNTMHGQLKKVASAWELLFINLGKSTGGISKATGAFSQFIRETADGLDDVVQKHEFVSDYIRNETKKRQGESAIKWLGGVNQEELKEITKDASKAFEDMYGIPLKKQREFASGMKGIEQSIKSMEKASGTVGGNLPFNTSTNEFDLVSSMRSLPSVQNQMAELEAKKINAQLDNRNSDEKTKLAKKEATVKAKIIQDELDGLSKIFKEGMVLHNAKMKFIRDEENAKKKSEKTKQQQESILSAFVGSKEGEGSELAALTSKYEEILTLDTLSNNQRLEAYRSYVEQRKEINKKSALEERNQIISNGLAINSALGGLVGSLGNLASVRTSNAVKAAEAEGKSEEQINAIRKKGFAEQKKYLVLQAIMNTAAGITKAYVDPGGPMGLVLAGIVGLSGAAQVAAISSQKFAKGFDGTVSQPTLIEVGEEGPEDVMVKPRAKSGLKSNSDKPMIQVIVQGDINGEEDFLRRVRSANEELDRRTV